MTDSDIFLAICRGEQKPDPTAYELGYDAREAGKAFHECPYADHGSSLALSWRVGWNDRALELNKWTVL